MTFHSALSVPSSPATAQLVKDFKKADDGSFWMAFEDFVLHYRSLWLEALNSPSARNLGHETKCEAKMETFTTFT